MKVGHNSIWTQMCRLPIAFWIKPHQIKFALLKASLMKSLMQRVPKKMSLVKVNCGKSFSGWWEIYKYVLGRYLFQCIYIPSHVITPQGVVSDLSFLGKIVFKIPTNFRLWLDKDMKTNICDGQRPYLIFVMFFTQPKFEAWKFYTWRCVNLQQKFPRDKTA